MPDNFDILARAAAGDPTAEPLAAKILLQANRAFFRDGCSMPLQRYAGLPCTINKLLKPRRDYWLRLAFVHSPGESNWAKCQALSAEVKRMREIFWPRWQYLTDPPPEASELRQALFCAMRLGVAIPTTAQQFSNIITKFSGDEIWLTLPDDEA